MFKGYVEQVAHLYQGMDLARNARTGTFILCLLPQAITSTRAMQRRLRDNWQRLHRLVYPATALACLHLLWQARSDVGDALFYLAIFAALLVWCVRRRSL